MKRVSTKDDSSYDYQEEEVELSRVRNPIQFNHEKLAEDEEEEDDNHRHSTEESNEAVIETEREQNIAPDEPLRHYSETTDKFSMYKDRIEQYLFDPRVPKEAQLFRKENICVVLCYVLVGLFEGITRVVMNGESA